MKRDSRQSSFILLGAESLATEDSAPQDLEPPKESLLRQQIAEIEMSGWVDDLIFVERARHEPFYRKLIYDRDWVHFVEAPEWSHSPGPWIVSALRRFPFPGGTFISVLDIPLTAEVIRLMMEEKYPESWVVKPASIEASGWPVWLSTEVVQHLLQAPQRFEMFMKDIPSVLVQFVDLPRQETSHPGHKIQQWEKFLNRFGNPSS